MDGFFCLTALALVLLGAAAMRSSEILAKTAGVLLILGFVAAFFCARVDGLSLYAVDLDRQYGGHAGAGVFSSGGRLQPVQYMVAVDRRAADHVWDGHTDELSRLHSRGQDAQGCLRGDRLSLSIDAPLGRDARTLVSLSTRD